MCGFVAILNKKQVPVESETIKKMTGIVLHRGPDSEGFFLDKRVGLGFRRLSIIDLEKGGQPLTNETGDVWIVFNGEIYNYRELRDWLEQKGHRFKTDTDTETILHLYEETGFDCPRFLRGMFGFVIWDKRKDLLFGARDHFGIKPVYWTETPRAFAFASEIKSLLELDGVPREVNPVAFHRYLTFQYVPDPDTMFQGIRKIPPAHRFRVEKGKLTVEPYWIAQFTPERDTALSRHIEKTKEVLAESVAKHRISDVPRGAFLSGGIDSTSIAALLRRHEEVKTFTVGFDVNGYSELEIARRTASRLGTDHHEILVSSRQYLEELPRLVWHQDEPVADPSAIALYFVARLASRHVTVVLSGEGADEFFGGYNIYREPEALKMFSYMPRSLRGGLGRLAARLPRGMKGRGFLLRGSKTVEERYFGNAFIFDEDLKGRIVADPASLKENHPWKVTRPIYSRVSDMDDVTKMQYLDIHTWLCGNILMKADKMTMANSLELRVPFIDCKVFEVASRIPAEYKIRGGTTKWVLREAMKDFIPEEIQSRKKLGFPVPIRHWLRKEFYTWAREKLESGRVDDWINKAGAVHLLEAHKAGKFDYSRQIWTLLIFILWHEIYIERAVRFCPKIGSHVLDRRRKQLQTKTG